MQLLPSHHPWALITCLVWQVDIMQSQTAADVAVIGANAKREAAILVNRAEADALQLEQQTKATWYSALKERLGWTNAEFLQYVKIKSLASQPSDSMVVGVGALGEQAGA